MSVLLLQFFWLSFALIGLAEFIMYAKIRNKPSRFLEFLEGTHTLAAALIAFATGMATFIVIVAPGCFLEMPITYLKAAYLIALTAAIAVLIRERSICLVWLKKMKPTKKQGLTFVLVGGVLLVEYYTAMLTGGQLSGDAKFELAQINLFAQRHLTIADPIFGINGIPVTVYSTSIFHAMQALAMTLLEVSAPWVWFYSHAFVRMIIWLSLFALIWELLGKKVRRNWAYPTLIILMFWYGTYFMEPELHNRIVLAWTALFIVGIKIWLEKKSVALLAAAAILIATSHPLNAVMAFGFLGMITLVMLFLRRINTHEIIKLAPLFLILILPMALYLYYPHSITEAGFNDSPSSGPSINLARYGPFVIQTFDPMLKWQVVVLYVILLAYLYFLMKFKNKTARILTHILVTVSVFIAYNPVLVSLIGYIYLLYLTRNNLLRIALVLLISYLSLIVYNPVLMTLLQDKLPLWVYSRFYDFNVLSFAAPIIGIMALTILPALRLYNRRFILGWMAAVTTMMVIFVPVVYPGYGNTIIQKRSYPGRRQQLDNLETVRLFDKDLRDQTLFSDDPDLVAIIPGVIVSNAFTIANEANAHPAVHISQRNQCARQLAKTMDATDLYASGITAIITTSSPTSEFGALLRDKKDIQLVRQEGKFMVYKVLRLEGQSSAVPSLCKIPPTQKR